MFNRMMKKVIYYLTCLWMLTACSSLPYDLSQTHYIEIQEGGMNMKIRVDEKEDIQYILNNLNTLKLDKQNDNEPALLGYTLSFYNDQNEKITMLTLPYHDNWIGYQGGPYAIIEGHVDTDYVEHLFMNEIDSFSYLEAIELYHEHPGVQYDGFKNQIYSEIKSIQDVIQLAKHECTIEYDEISVAYDESASMWRVCFSTYLTLGNCQEVYLDHEGKTSLIVYGE